MPPNQSTISRAITLRFHSACEIVLEDIDVQKYDIYSHQNEHIVRLTPEQLKAKMAEKEAAAKRA